MNEINNSNEQAQEVIVAVLRNRLVDILHQEKHHLTEEEFNRLKKYQKRVVKLFKKSMEFSDMISETYQIKEIGDEPRVVWSNKNGGKVETIDSHGIWKANYLEPSYCEVECSLDGIFNLLNAELLVSNELIEEAELEIYLHKVKLAKYFRNFIDNTQKIANGQLLPQ